MCHHFCSLWLLYTMISFPFSPSWTSLTFTELYSFPLLPQFPSAFPLSYTHVPSPHSLTTPATHDCARACNSQPQYSWGHKACLSPPYHHPFPPSSHHPVETYTWPVYAIRRSLSCAHPGITHRNTKLRLNLLILSYLRSSWITTQSSDLLSNLRTFLLWLQLLFGSLRIYQDHPRIYLTHPWYWR